jgi:hypothetical protein
MDEEFPCWFVQIGESDIVDASASRGQSSFNGIL